MTINNKNSNIELDDLLKAGEKMELKKKKCQDIILQVSTVVNDFEKYAKEAKIKEKTYSDIKKILKQNSI